MELVLTLRSIPIVYFAFATGSKETFKNMHQRLKINVCSGYPLSSPKGNVVTAKRMASLFSERGHDAQAIHTDQPPESDVLVALHAFKTAAASKYFAEKCPSSKLIVLLTGTDINGGIEKHLELAETIYSLVDRFVVAHPKAIDALPDHWKTKTTVIYPSVKIPEHVSMLETGLKSPCFTCVGHLRPVKNPHLMFRALKLLDESFFAYSIGSSLDQTDAQKAIINSRSSDRYDWIKDVEHKLAMAMIKKSLATINTSFSEGGANVIIEACHLETPVLASKIDGNMGLLGDSYAGYFDSNDAFGLSQLMKRCLLDSDFVQTLKQQVSERGRLFTYEEEVNSWLELIGNLRTSDSDPKP